MGFLIDSLLTEVLVVVATVLLWYYRRFQTVGSKFWSSRNIPHLPPTFLFGNNLLNALKENTGIVSMLDYQKHKHKKVLGYWSFNVPVLAVYDLDLVKNVLIKDFQHFHDHFHFGYSKGEPLTGNLFNLTGPQWRNLRVKLTPTFTSGKIKVMYSTLERCAEQLDAFLDGPAKRGEILDMKDTLARFQTNVISSVAFGIETNSLTNDKCEFLHFGLRAMNPTFGEFIKTIVRVFIPFLGKLFKFTQIPPDVSDFFLRQVRETVEYRKQNNVIRNDFMQLLIQLIDKGKIEDVDRKTEQIVEEISDGAIVESDTKFTLDEATAQAFVFFVAGFESSSSAMAFSLYELGRNKTVQDRLRNEIKEAAASNGGNIPYDVLRKLPYLDMVIKETLRKYPVIPILMREVTKDYVMTDFDSTLPKKTLVVIPTYAISHDPDIYPNPDHFDPERFSDEKVKDRHPMAYLPFGEGPRTCIGNRFALMQIKVGLASVFKKYSVEVCNNKPLKFDPKSFFLKSVDGIQIKLKIA